MAPKSNPSVSTGRRTEPLRPAGAQPAAAPVTATTPGWLLKALLSVLLLAAACVYASICLLFWQGQWQVIFRPSSHINQTPASVGLKFQNIKFDATETGVLRLTGWWVPGPESQEPELTVLYFHDGTGSLSDTVPELNALHNLGLNVFAFDYRGFGLSAKAHPSEKRMLDDGEAAYRYLTDMRKTGAGSIVLYGDGLGAAIAARITRNHPGATALVLANPVPPILEQLRQNSKLRFLPLRLIFHDRFNPIAALEATPTPKLFIYTTPTQAKASEYSSSPPIPLYYQAAVPPKDKVTIETAGNVPYYDAAPYMQTMARFLHRRVAPGVK